MLKIKGNIRVTCPNGHVFPVAVDEWELQDAEINEKPDNCMGNEVCHPFKLDYSCPVCGEEVEASIEVWEYPLGAEETREVSNNVNQRDAQSAIEVEP